MEYLIEKTCPEYYYPPVCGVKWNTNNNQVLDISLPIKLPQYVPQKYEIIYPIKIINRGGKMRIIADSMDLMPDFMRKIIKIGLFCKSAKSIIITDIKDAYNSVDAADLKRVVGVAPQPCVSYRGKTYKWNRGLLPGHPDSYRLFTKYLEHYLRGYNDFIISINDDIIAAGTDIAAIEKNLPPQFKLNMRKTRIINKLDKFMGYNFIAPPINKIRTIMPQINRAPNPRSVWLGNVYTQLRRILTLYWYIRRDWYNEIIAEIKKYKWVYESDLYIIDLNSLPVIFHGYELDSYKRFYN